jgi:hypothetical protein
MPPDLSRGFYWGILLLLLLPPVMIATLAGIIVYHARKNRRSLQDIAG